MSRQDWALISMTSSAVRERLTRILDASSLEKTRGVGGLHIYESARYQLQYDELTASLDLSVRSPDGWRWMISADGDHAIRACGIIAAVLTDRSA